MAIRISPYSRDGTCCRIGLNMADDSKREALQKILSRERADGFQDTTVIGGLDRFLQRWAGELEPAVGERGSYSVLTPPQRKRWSDEVMARLGDADGARPLPGHRNLGGARLAARNPRYRWATTSRG